MCTPEWANLFKGPRRAGGARSSNTRNGRTPTGDCNGISRRLIAERFKVSADAAWRHGREHLTPEIRAALATKVLAREGDLHRILLEEESGVVEALKAIRGPLFGMFLVAIDLRQARVCDAGDRCPGLHPTEPIGRVLRTAGMGHEDAFPPSRLSVGYRFSQATFTGTHGNERNAPIPVIR